MVTIQLKGSDKTSIFVASATILEVLHMFAVLTDEQIDGNNSGRLLAIVGRLGGFPPVDDTMPLVLIETPDRLLDPITSGSVAIRYRDGQTEYHTFHQLWELFVGGV
jgi:hypothetical protein